MKRKKYLWVTIAMAVLCSLFISFNSMKVEAASSKILAVNWSNIAAVGNQPKGSDACACYSLAYCRTMLDGKVHSWSEYDVNGGNPYNSCASWSKGGYGSTSGVNSAQAAYKVCYDSINNNRPAILFVTGSRSTWHYVTVIGYQNVTNANSLSASNFLIIDSCWFCSKSSAENMASAGYSAKNDGGYYYHTTSSGSVKSNGTSSNVKSNSSPVVKGEQTISNGRYHIVSNLKESMGLDVAGASKANGANINLYSNIKDNLQTFDVTYIGDGYYKIVNSYSGKAVDVYGGLSESGTNVHSYDQNGTNAQKWIIKETGDNYTYSIISACGYKYLDVAGGSTNNGTNVQIYDGNGTNAQKWKFIAAGNNIGKTIDDGEYHIVSALDNNNGIDVTGADKNNFANIQLYSNVNDSTQTFDVTYIGDGYYKIIGKLSGKSLDVKGCKTYKSTNVQLYEWSDTDAQKWIIKKNGDYYNIITKCSGMYLDVNGANSANGTNIQVYTGSNTNAQKWKFVPVTKEETITEEEIIEAITEQEDNSKEPIVTDEGDKDNKEEAVTIKETDKDNKVGSAVMKDSEEDVNKSDDVKTEEKNEVKDSTRIEMEDLISSGGESDTGLNRHDTSDANTVNKDNNLSKGTSGDDNYTWSEVWNDDDIEVEVPRFKKVKNVKTHTMKISICAVADADGYEYTVARVTNSTLKKFKKQVKAAGDERISFKGTKICSSKSAVVKLSGLKKNRKYAVAVRAYKIVDGEKYYSDYSSVKCIKVKK